MGRVRGGLFRKLTVEDKRARRAAPVRQELTLTLALRVGFEPLSHALGSASYTLLVAGSTINSIATIAHCPKLPKSAAYFEPNLVDAMHPLPVRDQEEATAFNR